MRIRDRSGLACVRDEQWHAPPRDRQGGQPSTHSEENTLGNQLPPDAPAIRAQRNPHA
jgi:hypothetical protein